MRQIAYLLEPHLKKVASTISWWRLILVAGPAFLLPFPNLFLNHSYKPSIEIVATSSPEVGKVRIDLPNNTTFSSASAITRLVGQELSQPPISVCLTNESKPIPSELLDRASSSVTDEIGALFIKIKDIDTSKTAEIYAKVGSTTCEVFPSGKVQVINAEDMEFNALFIAGQIDGQDAWVRYVDFGKTKIEVKVVFDLGEYILKVIILLLGIGVIIQIIGALTLFVTKH